MDFIICGKTGKMAREWHVCVRYHSEIDRHNFVEVYYVYEFFLLEFCSSPGQDLMRLGHITWSRNFLRY